MTESTTRRTSAASFATIGHCIDGGPVTSGTQRTFENRSPVDGSLVSPVAEAGADEVDAAVTAAKRALRGPWAGLSVADRGKLLHAVADEIDRPGCSPAAHCNRWQETPCRAAGKRSTGKQPMDTARIHRFAPSRGDAPVRTRAHLDVNTVY